MKSVICLAILFAVLVTVNSQNASCRKKCGGTSPRLENCRRSDNLWRWDGYKCDKMPVACYKVRDKDNAFTSPQACMKLCGPYS